MSESKFTPGPWHVGEGQQAQIVYDKDGWGIANAVVFHRAHEQGSSLANAKLIATAPDLVADLIIAAATLRRYEQAHRAKGTEESAAKAEVNADLAARFEATIQRATASPMGKE
jgi:hypothetical protein